MLILCSYFKSGYFILVLCETLGFLLLVLALSVNATVVECTIYSPND